MASEDPVYKVVSMVRQTATRNLRQKAASHHRFVQRLAGGAITVRRARPATINHSQLVSHLDQLKQASKEGRIEVRTVTGVLVDLDTLKPVEATTAAAPPVPKPPLDSAANDKTFASGVGEHIPTMPGGRGISELLDAPSIPGLPGSDEEPIEDSGDPVAARKKNRKKKSDDE